MITDSITTIVKNTISEYLSNGNIAVDLTAGNGNDTCFLAAQVGDEGRVYAFDIQAIAIEKTKKLIENNGYTDRVILINDGHENLSKYIKGHINVAMVNLGYLPCGDKNIITQPNTTIKGIKDVLELLVVGGVMSVVIYYGHEGGELEKEKVQAFLDNLDENCYDVMTISYSNRKKSPPITYFIHKRKVLDKF